MASACRLIQVKVNFGEISEIYIAINQKHFLRTVLFLEKKCLNLIAKRQASDVKLRQTKRMVEDLTLFQVRK